MQRHVLSFLLTWLPGGLFCSRRHGFTYAINVVIIAQAPYLSIIYNTFNVLPAIVCVIQLQKRPGHSDEQQNLNKICSFYSAATPHEAQLCACPWFPFLNNQRNDSMEQSPSGKAPTASMAKKWPDFYGTRKLSSCSKEPTTSYYSLGSILISI